MTDEREELTEIIGWQMYNNHQDPSGHTADAILEAGYQNTKALDALIDEAESRHGSSMYCKVTTYELRKALGQDVTNWPKRSDT